MYPFSYHVVFISFSYYFYPIDFQSCVLLSKSEKNINKSKRHVTGQDASKAHHKTHKNHHLNKVIKTNVILQMSFNQLRNIWTPLSNPAQPPYDGPPSLARWSYRLDLVLSTQQLSQRQLEISSSFPFFLESFNGKFSHDIILLHL